MIRMIRIRLAFDDNFDELNDFVLAMNGKSISERFAAAGLPSVERSIGLLRLQFEPGMLMVIRGNSELYGEAAAASEKRSGRTIPAYKLLEERTDDDGRAEFEKAYTFYILYHRFSYEIGKIEH